jgi:predicted small secreted protein
LARVSPLVNPCIAELRARRYYCAARVTVEKQWSVFGGKGRSMKKSLMLSVLVGASMLLSACATVKGLGRDIQSAGQAGEDAINGR